MTKELKADLSLLAITVVWGASFPIMSISLKYVPPYSLITIRYLLSAAILGFIFHKRLLKINKKMIEAGILIGFSLLLGSLFQVVGLLYTTPSKSGFITGLNVVLVPLFLAVMYKKLPNTKTVIGVIASVLGLGIMSMGGNEAFNKGDFLTLLSAVAYASQIILVDRLVKADMDVFVLSFLQFLIVGVFSFIPAVKIEHLNIQINTFSVWSIIFMALFCTIVAYGVQNKMQPMTSPVHAAIIFLAEPVFSAIFSLFIGDRLSGKTLIGCLLILVGMVIINIRNIRGFRSEKI